LAANLSEADRRKNEFLATLAHELRNPLAPIRNALQVMRLAPDRAAGEQARTVIERQLVQMVRLVDDLLDLSRISRGKLEIRREQVPLSAVVSSAVETSRPLIDHMGHEFTVTLPHQTIIVDADLTRLAQVFTNLLNNSAKYMDRGGHIRLTAERQGTDVVVSVKDTGIGIAADQLPCIFELFSQVDRSLERSQGGLGIGLTLVKRLVEMHGGRIEARSEGLGKGAEFVVRLPVVVGPSGPQAPSEKDEAAAPESSLRILIVDDNRDGADSLVMLLRIMGNDTRTAYDGQQGVDVAEEFRPDVILLDIGLPKLNGYEACRRIREQPWGKSVVLIAMTGWGQEDDRRRSHQAGFDHHLVKPVDPQNLMKLLAGLQQVKA
jgi:CheY-like chemotaxis protein